MAALFFLPTLNPESLCRCSSRPVGFESTIRVWNPPLVPMRLLSDWSALCGRRDGRGGGSGGGGGVGVDAGGRASDECQAERAAWRGALDAE